MKKIVFVFLFWIVFRPLSFSQSLNNSCNCEIPLDSTFVIVPMTQGPDQGIPPLYQNDNAATASISLPFSFCFYGQSFDSVFISNNGIISFAHPIYSFINGGGFPLGTDTLMIAPFYADAYTHFTTGLVYYKITPTHMIVRWDYVGFETFDQDYYNTFQLIITDGADPILPGGNNVSFCYLDMQWATADNSGGFDGFGGIPAIVGINKGNGMAYAQVSTFNVPGITYYGPFAAFNGLHWLNSKSFVFNTCVTGNTIPPVILNSPQHCDTVFACKTDTLTLTSTFLCAQPGQTATLAASYSGISNFSILNNSTASVIDSITVQLITTIGDTGTHLLTITATDNSAPVQVSTLSIVIVINNCTTGISEAITNSDFKVYPNPGKGSFIIETDNPPHLANDSVKIFDFFGNEVFSSTFNTGKTEIHLSSKLKGIYFLKLSRENTSDILKKIVIR